MRRRRSLLFGALAAAIVLAVLIGALIDRRTTAIALYIAGGAVLILALAGSMGGGPGTSPGLEREGVRVFRRDMQQRLQWQSQNLWLILGGAILVGTGALLDVL